MRQQHGNSSSKKMFANKHVNKCLQRNKTCWLNSRSLLRPTTRDEKQELSFPPTLVVLPPSHSPRHNSAAWCKGMEPNGAWRSLLFEHEVAAILTHVRQMTQMTRLKIKNIHDKENQKWQQCHGMSKQPGEGA